MYRIVTVENKIRVPPTKLGTNVKNAVRESIADDLEGVLDLRLGVVLAIIDVEKVGEGKIVAGDPGVYYNTVFKVLVYKPEMHELVAGEVIDNTEFGSFVRMGPMDGLIHISQLMDDYVSYDAKNSVFLGKESRHTLKEKDLVRARVIAVSFGKEEQQKIGLTMRQVGLGAINWIVDEKKKQKKGK